MARIILGCTFARGMYPKLTTARLTRGLNFVNGRVDITDSDLDELKKNDDFLKLYGNGRGREIFMMLKGEMPVTAPVPKVVTSSTTEGASEKAKAKTAEKSDDELKEDWMKDKSLQPSGAAIGE